MQGTAFSRQNEKTMDPQRYQQLIVWQRAMPSAKAICGRRSALPVDQRSGLPAPVHAAAVAVPDRIAEALGRLTTGESRLCSGSTRHSPVKRKTTVARAADLVELNTLDDRHTRDDLNTTVTGQLPQHSPKVSRGRNGLIRSLSTNHHTPSSVGRKVETGN